MNNGGGYPTLDQVARVFQIDTAMVGNALYENANEAQAEAVTVVWPDNVLVCYAPDAPTIDDPSFGYSFRWSAPGIPELNIELHPYDGKIKADEVEVGYYQAEQITGASYGFLLVAVNSAQA